MGSAARSPEPVKSSTLPKDYFRVPEGCCVHNLTVQSLLHTIISQTQPFKWWCTVRTLILISSWSWKQPIGGLNVQLTNPLGWPAERPAYHFGPLTGRSVLEHPQIIKHRQAGRQGRFGWGGVSVSACPLHPALLTTQRLVPPEWRSLLANGLINNRSSHRVGNLTLPPISSAQGLNLPNKWWTLPGKLKPSMPE